ncbi:MAG: sulfite exporter TauE/SafE family protein [Oscillospiraceae bacterium]|nr:sulfite exporter TauE/SafE family protein [Oscillospiraceae bacterium]
MLQLIIKVVVCFIAGVGAGLGTGFAGMSAAVVITPMLITFLNMDAYHAVGIALASDVLASGVSAYEYGKNKNLDIKNGLIMMCAVLVFTVVGSWVSSFMPNKTMGNTSMIFTLFMGIKFIARPVMTTRDAIKATDARTRALQSLGCGAAVGFVCGFIGAGGGMMMLLVLTTVMHYDLKTAVGTSVFIMAFTALTGAGSHIVIGGMPDWGSFALCILFTLIWARVGSIIANKAKPITLNRVTGIILIVLSVVILFVNFVLK